MRAEKPLVLEENSEEEFRWLMAAYNTQHVSNGCGGALAWSLLVFFVCFVGSVI